MLNGWCGRPVVRVLVLAVDGSNTPAIAMYEQCGLFEWERRRVMAKFFGETRVGRRSAKNSLSSMIDHRPGFLRHPTRVRYMLNHQELRRGIVSSHGCGESLPTSFPRAIRTRDKNIFLLFRLLTTRHSRWKWPPRMTPADNADGPLRFPLTALLSDVKSTPRGDSCDPRSIDVVRHSSFALLDVMGGSSRRASQNGNLLC